MEAVHQLLVLQKIKAIGSLDAMDDYEKRKLGIFNVLNVLGFVIGIFLPINGLLTAGIRLPAITWVITFLPAMVSVLVLVLNYFRRYESAVLCYFFLYPVLTALVYRVTFDIGIELFFFVYAVLAVFFLRRFMLIVLAFVLTLACYFYVFVFARDYQIFMVKINFPFYVVSHLLPAIFIFYSLFLVKKENAQYQLSLLESNDELHRVNMEIQRQKEVIDDKARLLQRQKDIIDEKARQLEKKTEELTELNAVKNKLFSVISHDLKAPLYALRNLFRSVQQYDVPAEDIKLFIPEVVKDLNYTTSLMENLLIWVKSQMQINTMQPQILEVGALVKESMDLLRLQAHTKNISIECQKEAPVFIYADKDMISLVIRNLLSNAVKFTPDLGVISITITEARRMVEISVTDSGVGMDDETVKKLFSNNFFTTKGTANETGTGLGLMLCKDFLNKNGGTLKVSSQPGKGSTFSFTLPRKMME
jgi:two-component system, sensor histidine kinase and response regulator